MAICGTKLNLSQVNYAKTYVINKSNTNKNMGQNSKLLRCKGNLITGGRREGGERECKVRAGMQVQHAHKGFRIKQREHKAKIFKI